MNKNKKMNIMKVMLIFLVILGFFLGCYFIFKDSKVNNDSSNKELNEEKLSEDKNEVEKDFKSTPLLYEVTKDGSDTKIYLFGSIHVADGRAYPMPEKVISAYNESKYLAVEFDMIAYSKDFQEQIESLQLLTFKDGNTIKKVMHEESYNLMVSYLKENDMYSSLYELYKPAMFYSLVANVQAIKGELYAEKGIDMYFLERAKKDKKEILELESAKYQYEMLASFPDEMFDYLIKYSILNDETLVESTKKLYEAWLLGNEEDILKYAYEDNEGEIKGNYDEYEISEEVFLDYDDKLIYTRNKEMTTKIDEYYNDEKSVFLVVGIAHIIGDDGIVDLLSELGYKVNKVTY